MSSELRKLILQAKDLPREAVQVPEWPAVNVVYVRTLTGTERDEFEQSVLEISKGKDLKFRMANIRARLCAMAMTDKDGNAIFDAEDAAALGTKSAKVLDRIFAVAQRLSGISEKDVESLSKNSGSGPSAAFTSDLPLPSAVPSGSCSPELTPAN